MVSLSLENQRYEDELADEQLSKRERLLDDGSVLTVERGPWDVSGFDGLTRKDDSLDNSVGIEGGYIAERSRLNDKAVRTRGERPGPHNPPTYPVPCHERAMWKRLRCLFE